MSNRPPIRVIFNAPRDQGNPKRGDIVRVFQQQSRILPLWVKGSGAVTSYHFAEPIGKSVYEPVWCAKMRHAKDGQFYNFTRWVPLPELYAKRLGNDRAAILRAAIANPSGTIYYQRYLYWLSKLKPSNVDDFFDGLTPGELNFQLSTDSAQLARLMGRVDQAA